MFSVSDLRTSDIVIVEDDRALATLMAEYLQSQGFRVTCAADGVSGEALILREQPRVAIVDLMLPLQDGLSLCRRVRARFVGGLLVLTASDDDFDQVAALEAGADDFVSKPVRPRVLLARLRALLRRLDSQQSHAPMELAVGLLQLDIKGRRARWGERVLELTTTEFDLLLVLAQRAGQIVDRETLSTSLRGLPYDGLDRAIDLRVSRLRRALGDDAGEPRLVRTVRGRGYVLHANETIA